MISFLLSAAGMIKICSAFSVPEHTSRSISSRPSVVWETIHRHRHHRQPTELWSSALSSNEDLLPGISVIDDANDVIFQQMEVLQDSLYFRLFCVDILASCEYLPQELFECYSETCEVYPVDDEEVPENIREVDFQEHDFELDGWARWDMPSNDYYDLEEFPEGYTGYDGREIWEFIHGKVAFTGYDYDDNHWKADFNKAVSGIHSLISAHVTKGIQDKIDAGEEFTDDEVWRDPKVEYDRRLGRGGEQPMAMENLYFAYMLFLSAAAKAKDKLLLDCENGSIDSESSTILKGFLELPVLCDPAVEVASKKLHDHAVESQNNLWEARMRTRDLLRIMNCVQCNKCRLHGKVAMLGLSTALQIHLGRTGEGGDPNRIHRVELAALLCTIQKFSKAVEYCKSSR
mmetsp:Transcript_20010/g.43522  ORF Transcript_20010/g.43522 Transcript_20010/m.43522 type:complete len:402 (+) Transcript_20010:274-1479(+)